MAVYQATKELSTRRFVLDVQISGWQVPLTVPTQSAQAPFDPSAMTTMTKTCVFCLGVHPHEVWSRCEGVPPHCHYMKSQILTHTHTHKQAHFPSRQLIPPIIPWLEYACHHRDKQQSHRGIVGYLSPSIYRQPVTPDGWESGFICLSPSLLDSLFAFYSVLGFFGIVGCCISLYISL